MATRQNDGYVPLPESGTVTLPDPPEEPEPEQPGEAAGAGAGWSRFDDIEALLDDVLTYLDAEVAFQKTRVSFLTNSIKKIVAFVVVALFLATLAAIGLTIGLIFALSPLVTPWGATAIVVGGMLLLAALLVRKALKTWTGAMAAINSDTDTPQEPTQDV